MTMDVGFSVVESLKAVESWINNINTNMVGAAKTGYKATRISFGGSNATVTTLPSGGLLPSQQAETSMRISSTAIDFTQGQLVASSQNTHFAIKDRPAIAGTNFFVVREQLDNTGVSTNTANTYTYYLTRDGEFHWVPATGTVGSGNNAVTFGGNATNGFALVNNYNLVAINQNGNPIFTTGGNFGIYPAAATQAQKNTQDLTERPIVSNISSPQNLVFSRYGSTLFSTTASAFTDVSQDAAAASQKGDRVQSSLESSNSSVTTLIPELTLAQKMFTALSKVLTVFNENLDITFGLIR